MIDVPAGYSARTARREDIEAVWRLMVTINMAESGRPGWGRAEFENWVTGAPMVVERDVMMVHDLAGELAAAELFSVRDPYVRPFAVGGVHPDYVGQGLGSALMGWVVDRARAGRQHAPPDAAVTLVAFTAVEHDPTDRLMSHIGMALARYFVDMELEFDSAPEEPVLPEGVEIRLLDPERDVEAVAAAHIAGFRDHYGFVDEPVPSVAARLRHWMSADSYDPRLWWVAVADGDIVGFNICDPENEGDPTTGYVATLAVVRSHRGRGVGRALLLTSFGEFYRRGLKGVALGVDVESLTGATRLYESVGMQPGVEYAAWELVIRDGRELATLDLAGD